MKTGVVQFASHSCKEVFGEYLAIQVQLHSFLNCSCTADHDEIRRIQIYSFKVD